MGSDNNQNPFHNTAKNVGKFVTYGAITVATKGITKSSTLGLFAGGGAGGMLNEHVNKVGEFSAQCSDRSYEAQIWHSDRAYTAAMNGNPCAARLHAELAEAHAGSVPCIIL
jgi:hypothetical protein